MVAIPAIVRTRWAGRQFISAHPAQPLLSENLQCDATALWGAGQCRMWKRALVREAECAIHRIR